jgi:hypothetical protein
MHATAALVLANDRIAELLADGQRNRLATDVRATHPHHHSLPAVPAIARRLAAAVRALPGATAG